MNPPFFLYSHVSACFSIILPIHASVLLLFGIPLLRILPVCARVLRAVPPVPNERGAVAFAQRPCINNGYLLTPAVKSQPVVLC